MSYLNDTEKRLLFSALSREKEVCKQVDKECCREPYEDTLQSVVENLEKKFYYDRFEKEIRVKAIDEFAEKIKSEALDRWIYDFSEPEDCYCFCGCVNKIAEQMKAGGDNTQLPQQWKQNITNKFNEVM